MQHRHLAFMLMNAIAASSAMAHTPDRIGRRPPPPAEMARQLGLDASQTAQFVAIMEEQRTKHRALHEQADADREAMRTKMDALHEETRARLGAVLNAEQLARFEELRPRPPGPPPERRERGPEGVERQ
jgi:hypothetical protein